VYASKALTVSGSTCGPYPEEILAYGKKSQVVASNDFEVLIGKALEIGEID
jgi:hypothetical protein